MNPSTAVLISAWASDHWWLAFWLVFWIGAWAFLLSVAMVRLTRLILIRPLRALQVLCRGWPPAHLDADGNWAPAPKVDVNVETARVGDAFQSTTRRVSR